MDQGNEVKLSDMTHVNLTSAHVGSLSDEISDDPSSPESTTFDDSDMLGHSVSDDVTTQLAAAGPIGIAAAAAIASGKKRKRPHNFETNPSIRKRQATRLIRKLKQVIDEFTTRVGQQAVVVICCPGKVNSSYKVFGASPLETVVRNCKQIIMQDLEHALQQQAPQPQQDNSGLHELPPLVIEGIPTPVGKMTQAQLRAFIPIMLKYSTGRGKPGWGKESTRPSWWPEDVPWANVRSDVRSEDQKSKVSWTNALRTIVESCYRCHGREDLLVEFSEVDEQQQQQQQQQQQHHHHQQQQQHHHQSHQFVTSAQYPQMVHTINNADGTVSIIQVDASGTLTTISEAACHSEATQAVATLAEVAAASQGEVIIHGSTGNTQMEHSGMQSNGDGSHNGTSLGDTTLHDGGHLLLGDAVSAAAALVGVQDGSGIVSIPVQAAAAMMQIQGGSIIPMTTVQFISSSSVPAQVAMQSGIMTTASNGEIQQIQMSDGVPAATQAVEVVTLADSSNNS